MAKRAVKPVDARKRLIAWGRDPSAFTPPEYGTYATLSTAVYRCVDLRAKNLARLPLKLWRANAVMALLEAFAEDG